MTSIENSGDDPVAAIRVSIAGLVDKDYEYEQRLTRLVATAGNEFETRTFAALENLPQNTDEAYALFYALNIYHRRMKEYTELTTLVRLFGDQFRTRDTYPHLQSLCYLATRRLEEAFYSASVARERAPLHAGVLHNYAVVVLDREGAKASPDDGMLDQARESLDAALATTGGSYARHHATYARFYLLRGEYEAAEEALDRAVDLEERGIDYPVRIGEYEAIRLSNRVAKSSAEFAREQRRMLDELEDLKRSVETRVGAARSEAVQLLGLLAAIIAFIVATTSIAAQLEDFQTSGRLLVLLTGSILVVYTGFSTVFGSPSWKHLVVLMLGLAVCAFAVFRWTAA